RDRHAEHHAVADGVAEHGLPAHHQERPEQRRRGGRQHPREQDGERHVVEEGLDHAPSSRTPRRRPNASARAAQAVATSTTVGPVERPGTAALASAPTRALKAPTAAESQSIAPTEPASCRAATAGATTSADISTTPTSCRPTTMATASSSVSSVS